MLRFAASNRPFWFHPLSALTLAGLSACTVVEEGPGEGPGQAGGGGGASSSQAGGGGGGAGSSSDPCDPYAPRSTAPSLIIGPDDVEPIGVAEIDKAQSTLDLSMYQLTHQPFITALIAAQARGVTVRVQLDSDQYGYSNARSALMAAGIEVKSAPSEFNHAHSKVLIVDGAEAVIMSANMNGYSVYSERNYGVVDVDPDDVADAQAIFERDWSGGDLDLSCTRLIVTPENAEARLLKLVNDAKESLALAVMYLSHDDVRQAVKDRANAGVSVRVLLADPGWIDGNAETAAELVGAGIDTRYLKNSVYELHAKLIIADGVAFVGSENLSWTSLNKNREVGLLVSETEPAAAIEAVFEQDWAKGVSP